LGSIACARVSPEVSVRPVGVKARVLSLLVVAILIAAFAPGSASATVQSVTAVDEDGAPTDSYMLTDGVYAKVPTSASGGYVCAVRPGATACAAKAIPIPPFSAARVRAAALC
jgi:hypothetical protein